MPSLAERLLSHIRHHELLIPGDRVGVAVSGGIDSVALLRLLLELRTELGIVLSVVHFNHKLRGEESDGDQHFVNELARAYKLDFYSDSSDVAEHATQAGMSVEASARELRYAFFRHLLDGNDPAASENTSHPHTPPRINKIATGHTLDDQAETVLMRIVRGTGLTGLAGIYRRIPVENDDGELCGEIVRPLLGTRRCELEQYLHSIGQDWREDSTNADHLFTRNRTRRVLIPLLQKEFNPAVAGNLAELAEIARGEEEYWENEVAGWMGTAVHWIEPEWAKSPQEPALIQISLPTTDAAQLTGADLRSKLENAGWLVMNASVSRPWFLSEPVAVQRRVLKAVAEHAGFPLEFKHVEELRQLAEHGHSGSELSLPLGWKAVCHPEELLFVTPDLRHTVDPQPYEYELSIPCKIQVPGSGTLIHAQRVPAQMVRAYNPDELLDADSLPGPLKVRNWRPGDRFWPAHTKSPKKIKEMLQERQVSQPERAHWPAILSGDVIVWVRGFAAHKQYRPRDGKDALRIFELGPEPSST